MSLNSTKILVLVISTLLSVTFFIISCAMYYKLYLHRSKKYVAVRPIPYLHLIPITLNVTVGMYLPQLIYTSHEFDIIKLIVAPVGPPMYYGMLYCFLYRIWITFYKLRWSFYSEQNDYWRSIICSEVVMKKNFFTKHHDTLGNPRYVKKMALCAFGVSVTLLGLAVVLFYVDAKYQPFMSALSLILSVPVALVYVVVASKMQSDFITDMFYVHWELTMHSRLLLAYFIFTIGYKVIFSAVYGWPSFTTAHMIAHLCVRAVLQCILMAVVYVSTVQVIKKNVHTNTKLKIKKIKLTDILSSDLAFAGFMAYLQKEFSMEYLLSFVEFQQFEKYLLKTLPTKRPPIPSLVKAHALSQQKPAFVTLSDDSETCSEKKVPDRSIFSVLGETNQEFYERIRQEIMPLSNQIPRSTIVHTDYDEKNRMNAIRVRAVMLYNKYIADGSEFEINIPISSNNEWRDYISEDDIFESESDGEELIAYAFRVLRLTHMCKHEMVLLLVDSLPRFQYSDEYLKVVKQSQKL